MNARLQRELDWLLEDAVEDSTVEDQPSLTRHCSPTLFRPEELTALWRRRIHGRCCLPACLQMHASWIGCWRMQWRTHCGRPACDQQAMQPCAAAPDRAHCTLAATCSRQVLPACLLMHESWTGCLRVQLETCSQGSCCEGQPAIIRQCSPALQPRRAHCTLSGCRVHGRCCLPACMRMRAGLTA